VRTKDLLDELPHEVHGALADAPINIEDAVLEGLQQQGRVRGPEVLG